MDKIEYEKLKAEIISKYGKAEFDYDRTPLNESAKQLSQLRIRLMHEGRNKAKQGKLQALESSIPEVQRKVYQSVPLPVIELLESDLRPFDEVEKDILRAHYSDLDITNKSLGLRFHKSTNQITALLNSPAVQILDAKVFDKLMPLEVRKSLLRAVRGDDSKITQRLAEHYNLVKTEEINLNVNKPIEDVEAMKMLKDLGDKLAEGKTESKE